MSKAVRELAKSLPQRSRWLLTMPPTRKYPVLDRQMSDRWLLSQLKKILKKLRLKGHCHTFRHSFISDALVKGVSETIVREWVGQIDPEILKMYTHILDDVSRQAMRDYEQAGEERDDENNGDEPANVAG